MIKSTHLPDNFLRYMNPAYKKPLGKAGLTVQEAVAVADGKAELDLQGDIAGYLRLHEIEYIKPDGRKKSPLPPGWPDFTFCYRGVAVGMEVKTPTGTLSGDQVTQHERMRRNGWRMEIVRSLPEVQALLRAIDAEKAQTNTLLGQNDQPPAPVPRSHRTSGQDRPACAGSGAQFISTDSTKGES